MSTYKWRIFDRTQGGSLYLEDDDICLYYMDKTNGRPSDSEPNQRIYNLKIDPSKMTKAQRDAGWKQEAITQCADDMAGYLRRWKTVDPANTILVPVPPSKPVGAKGYDNRMILVCKAIYDQTGIRYIDCLRTRANHGAMHNGGLARDIDRLRQNIDFYPQMIPEGIQYVILIDDQLTKGTHFKAIKPFFDELGYIVVGMFWAKEHFKGNEGAW